MKKNQVEVNILYKDKETIMNIKNSNKGKKIKIYKNKEQYELLFANTNSIEKGFDFSYEIK